MQKREEETDAGNAPRVDSDATRELTPYEKCKASGAKSSFYSPDGFVKIEEFDNGMRFLHSPIIGYPVTLSASREV